MRNLLLIAAVVAALLLLGGGCKKKKYYIVPVQPPNDPPTVNAIADRTAALNQLFAIDIAVAGTVSDDKDAIADLTFAVTSGSGSFVGPVYKSTFTSAGSHVIDFTVTDSDAASANGSFTVNVFAPPVASFTSDVTSGEPFLAVNFTDTSLGCVTDWEWDFNYDGTVDSTVQNPQYIFDNEGVYTVSLTATGPGGTGTRVEMDYITVAAAPSPDFYADKTSVQGIVPVYFTDASTGTVDSWEWDFENDGVIDAYVQNPTHVYTTEGFHTVSLTVGNMGIKATATKTNYINVDIVILHVDGGVTASGDGATWATAFKTIQEGLSAAQDNEMVLVADGTYAGTGNKDLDFAGKEVYLKSLNGAAACIIDCEFSGRGVYINSSETSNTVVDGFTIINGYSATGSGIHCEGASPTISNCVFENNNASDTGGGIYCYNNANPSITDCLFDNNSAVLGGGGICCDSTSGIVVTDSTFRNNTAYSGGGICATYCDTTVTACIFDNNMAEWVGGGMMGFGNSSHSIVDCTFTDNEADWGGGANFALDAIPSIINCTFDNNAAIMDGGGN
ncbi:MAG: PKD domain-containing protein [Planctomycetota bacterium]|nr:MAG: PKD domain-containing protein [Planctomycetota bacterium]